MVHLWSCRCLAFVVCHWGWLPESETPSDASLTIIPGLRPHLLIPKLQTEGSIQYNSFTSAAAALKESGRGSLLTKLDLKDTYRHIPMRSTDWKLIGVPLDGKILLSSCPDVQGEVGSLHIQSICGSTPLDNPEAHPS